MLPENLKNKTFLSKKAGSFSGTPQRTVQGWTDKGFIESRTSGTGDRRQYTVDDCVRIAVAKSLSRHRLSHGIIEGIMEILRRPGRLEAVLSGGQCFIFLRLNTEYTLRHPQINFWTLKKGESIDKKEWIDSTTPNDCEEILVINVKKIAEKVVSAILTDTGV